MIKSLDVEWKAMRRIARTLDVLHHRQKKRVLEYLLDHAVNNQVEMFVPGNAREAAAGAQEVDPSKRGETSHPAAGADDDDEDLPI